MTETGEAPKVLEPHQYVELTADIVAAYVSHNQISGVDLTDLIGIVHRSLVGINRPAPPPAEELRPAVSIGRSVRSDYIVCLEDGLKFKSLKRHLRTSYDLSPEQYREKWGLPPDYPMVAPNYALARSELAKKAGFGLKRAKAAPTSTAKPRARKAK